MILFLVSIFVICMVMVALAMYMLYQCCIVRLSIYRPCHHRVAPAKAFVERYGGLQRIENAGKFGIEVFGSLAAASLACLLALSLFWAVGL